MISKTKRWQHKFYHHFIEKIRNSYARKEEKKMIKWLDINNWSVSSLNSNIPEFLWIAKEKGIELLQRDSSPSGFNFMLLRECAEYGCNFRVNQQMKFALTALLFVGRSTQQTCESVKRINKYYEDPLVPKDTGEIYFFSNLIELTFVTLRIWYFQKVRSMLLWWTVRTKRLLK